MQSAKPEVQPDGPVLVKPGNRIEHFWLCGPCSMELTITYDRELGALVVPKSRARKAAS